MGKARPGELPLGADRHRAADASHSDHIGDLGEVAQQSWLGAARRRSTFTGRQRPTPTSWPEDAEGDIFGSSGTTEVVKGFAQAYNADAAFRIVHHGTDYLPPEGARMIGHDIPKPGAEEAVTVFDKDGLKIEAFLVSHDPAERPTAIASPIKGASPSSAATPRRCRT